MAPIRKETTGVRTALQKIPELLFGQGPDELARDSIFDMF
jgi:hypothetical protein